MSTQAVTAVRGSQPSQERRHVFFIESYQKSVKKLKLDRKDHPPCGDDILLDLERDVVVVFWSLCALPIRGCRVLKMKLCAPPQPSHISIPNTQPSNRQTKTNPK
jgi:hypothetical protein